MTVEKDVARLYGVATLGTNVYVVSDPNHDGTRRNSSTSQVSPWMEHGDAIRYVENNPHADRVKIV